VLVSLHWFAAFRQNLLDQTADFRPEINRSKRLRPAIDDDLVSMACTGELPDPNSGKRRLGFFERARADCLGSDKIVVPVPNCPNNTQVAAPMVMISAMPTNLFNVTLLINRIDNRGDPKHRRKLNRSVRLAWTWSETPAEFYLQPISVFQPCGGLAR
jgi:hypothetical protein